MCKSIRQTARDRASSISDVCDGGGTHGFLPPTDGPALSQSSCGAAVLNAVDVATLDTGNIGDTSAIAASPKSASEDAKCGRQSGDVVNPNTVAVSHRRLRENQHSHTEKGEASGIRNMSGCEASLNKSLRGTVVVTGQAHNLNYAGAIPAPAKNEGVFRGQIPALRRQLAEPTPRVTSGGISSDSRPSTNHRTCSRCGHAKPLSEFYLQKGKPRPHCKSCHKQYSNRWAEENRDKQRESWRKSQRRQYAEHGTLYRLRSRFLQAMRVGKIVPQPCVVCGQAENVEAHHDDYTKPFDVQWLCVFHHNQLHKDRRAKGLPPLRDLFRKGFHALA